MKLITNKISLKKGASFEDLLKKITAPEVTKKASTENKTVKVAKKEEEKSSGQLKVEPLHQKGESTPKVKKTDKGEDCKPCMAGSESKVVVAKEEGTKSSGQLDVEPLHQKGESTPKVHKKEEKPSAKNIVESTDKEKNSGQPEWEGKKEHNNDPWKDAETPKKASEVLGGLTFTKIAKLNKKTKNWLKSYYNSVYPKQYTDKVTADYQ